MWCTNCGNSAVSREGEVCSGCKNAEYDGPELEEPTDDRVVTYQDDTVRVFACGCRESKLEAPHDDFTHCALHHKWIKADEWGYNCWCGAYKEN